MAARALRSRSLLLKTTSRNDAWHYSRKATLRETGRSCFFIRAVLRRRVKATPPASVALQIETKTFAASAGRFGFKRVGLGWTQKNA